MNFYELKEQYVKYYYGKFLNYKFKKILIGNEDFEKELISNLKNVCETYLVSRNIISNHLRFFKNRHSFILTLEYNKPERVLVLNAFDEKGKMQNTYLPINHFGSIREVKFSSPDYLKYEISEISDFFREIITTAYTAFENAFLDKCKHIAENICKRADSILVNHLESSSKGHLSTSVKFFIFHKEIGVFYFDKEAYKELINKYKKNQNPNYSPFGLITLLLTNPLPFNKSLSLFSFQDQGNIVSQDFNNKTTFASEKRFFEATANLFDFKPYSVVALCRTRDNMYKLSIAFRNADKKELIPEIQKIKSLLIEQFLNDIDRYSSIIGKFNFHYPDSRFLIPDGKWGEFWELSLGHSCEAYMAIKAMGILIDYYLLIA